MSATASLATPAPDTVPSTLTLAGLSGTPLWVAWQTEDRPDGKPTKVPYSPDGGKARADNPSTWGTRPAAEKRALVLPKPYGIGGVGIEFAPLGDGRSVGGVDLDSCRVPETGALEAWAEDTLAAMDTYAEISPSGTGAKAFFTYDSASLPALQAIMGGASFGKQFKRGGGEHPPAIELHLGNRYFAVTDNLLAGASRDLRHVEASVLQKLIQVDGPAFVGIKSDTRIRLVSGGSTDRSRSGAAFRVGKQAVLQGADFDGMCEELRIDPDTADWMREKGEPNGFREARRIFEKASRNGPIIRIEAGQLHDTATEGEAAIIDAGKSVYQRGNALVRPVVQDVPADRGRMTVSAALHEIDGHGLVDLLCSSATWMKFDGRVQNWVPTNAPRNVADVILSRVGQWSFPKIVGVITTPTIRPDGSILSDPGYDAATRLFHAADPAVVLSPTVHKPTKADAVEALATLQGLLVEFPFVEDANEFGEGPHGVSRSVALSGLITPIVRGALAVVPLHAFKANTAGSGKSYLVDTSSAISSGRPCPVNSAGADEVETEKRLTGMLLAGFPIAALDNVNGELGGDLLCQAIERPFVRLRPLGRSGIVEIESRATLFATGNNLRVRGDMVRRTLVCELDAGVERPELREFRDDPVAAVMKDRGKYVSACLIIVRAYMLAGRPGKLPPIASFSDWSHTVRSALVWLGCADPAASMEQARVDDPELTELLEVVSAWPFAIGEGHTVKDMADAADERLKSKMGEPTDPAHPVWRDCLVRLAGDRGTINTRRLGKWLVSREGRIVAKKRFKRKGPAEGGVLRWTLETVRT